LSVLSGLNKGFGGGTLFSDNKKRDTQGRRDHGRASQRPRRREWLDSCGQAVSQTTGQMSMSVPGRSRTSVLALFASSWATTPRRAPDVGAGLRGPRRWRAARDRPCRRRRHPHDLRGGAAPVGTKPVDVALLLAKMLVPEPMRPAWSEVQRMSASRLPFERLLDIDARMREAAARPVIVPDQVVIDHGRVFVSPRPSPASANG
jgi:hypothetical protein